MMEWLDNLKDQFTDLDSRAAGLAVLATMFLAFFMFSNNSSLGWDRIPLVWKIITVTVGPVVWYYVALWQINK